MFVTNTGNVRTDGTVDLSFDPLQQFVSSNPAAVLNGNTLSWDWSTLELGEVVMLNATVLTPSNVPLGTQLVCMRSSPRPMMTPRTTPDHHAALWWAPTTPTTSG